jgi:uncharacterized protein YdhG (YjbR/CyaY superfamily)
MKKATPVPATVDEYIAGFPKDVQAVLGKIRATIRAAAPKAEESISYRIPAYKMVRPLVYFAGFKEHVSLYPVTAPIKKKFEKELSPYEMSTGTVRFPLGEPIPYPLIGRIVKFMVQENQAKLKVTRK